MNNNNIKKIFSFFLAVQFVFVPSLSAQDKKADAAKTEKKEEIKEDPKDIKDVVDTSMFEKTGGDIWLNKRVSISPMFGLVMNDLYYNIMQFGFAANYNLTQRSGVEMTVLMSSASENDVVTFFENRFSATPDRNKPNFFLGFGYTYTAFTSTLNFKDSRKIPYLIKVAPGLGITSMSSKAYPIPPLYSPVSSVGQIGITFSADLIQEFYLSDRLAVRIDVKNHVIPEQVYKADTATSLRSRLNISTALMFGATWYCLPTSTKFKFSECL